jgi:hypothetical protein
MISAKTSLTLTTLSSTSPAMMLRNYFSKSSLLFINFSHIIKNLSYMEITIVFECTLVMCRKLWLIRSNQFLILIKYWVFRWNLLPFLQLIRGLCWQNLNKTWEGWVRHTRRWYAACRFAKFVQVVFRCTLLFSIFSDPSEIPRRLQLVLIF